MPAIQRDRVGPSTKSTIFEFWGGSTTTLVALHQAGSTRGIDRRLPGSVLLQTTFEVTPWACAQDAVQLANVFSSESLATATGW